MLTNLTISSRICVFIIIGLIFLVITIINGCHLHKHSNNVTKIVTLCLFLALGLCVGSILSCIIVCRTAISHGADKEAVNTLSYSTLRVYNKHSIKETNMALQDLKGKAVIFVRYDCPDCLQLHNSLNQIDDIIFIASRSKLGLQTRSTYSIMLTDVPQGVYIDPNGNAITINIVNRETNSLILDETQIIRLREMERNSLLLSDRSIEKTTQCLKEQL